MKTRREFIRDGIAAGATLALTGACGARGENAAAVDDAAIEALRSRLAGSLIVPGDAAYEAARAVVWRNVATDRRPMLVARCAATDDVARCVEFAAQHGLPVAVRSGGHAFVGWGTCDDGVVIDMSEMNDVTVDPSARTARVGGGILTRDLVAAAVPHGLVPVVGQCPSAGAAGVTLGGGLGWLSGSHGAACDNLLVAELMTADSRRLVASGADHPDLFWAIRGGGGNFGVATSFTYRLHPMADVLAGTVSYALTDAPAVLRTFAEVMAGAPDELQARAVLSREGEGAVHVNLCCSAIGADAERIVLSLRRAAGPLRDTVQRVPFIETFAMSGGIVRAFSAVKGSYVERLSDEAIRVVLDALAEGPNPGAAIGLDHYVHGEVCRVAPDATAFELRAPGAVHAWISAAWESAAAGSAAADWIDATWRALQVHSGGRVYANFPAAEDEAAARAAYGGNYARLLTVKNEYDPANLFRRNQNIRPVPA